jgi:uncharacterized membrane protein
MTQTMELDMYLSSLNDQLGPLPAAEREEILREIGAHIRDSAEENGSGVEAVLARLGPPEELAAQYRDGLLIQRASRSVSPVLLLRGAMRMATKGLFGVVVLFAGILGYAVGAGFVISGLIKPLFPAHTGFWVRNGTFVGSGTMVPIPQSPAHEILGSWYTPLALILGVVILLLTSFLVRAGLRTSKRVQATL